MPMPDTVIAIEPGLRLRSWHSDDLDDLLRHADDAEVVRGLSHRFPHPYTRADGEAFLAGQVVDLRDPVFAIEIDGRACGGIGLRLGQGECAVGADLGYWLGRAHWGKGHMTRIVGMFAPWALREFALERLQATVFDFNAASACVLEKNGFAHEATLRRAVRKDGQVHDLLMYARLSDCSRES